MTRKKKTNRVLIGAVTALCLTFGATMTQSAANVPGEPLLPEESEKREVPRSKAEFKAEQTVAEILAKDSHIFPTDSEETVELPNAPKEQQDLKASKTKDAPKDNTEKKSELFKPGWTKKKEYWYYISDNGKPMTKWQQIEGKWYYFNDVNGRMQIGWIQDEGTWYYLTENGDMATGWIQLSEGWYYLHENGAMATGWILDNTGKNYYLQKNGLWDPYAPPILDEIPDNNDGPKVALTFDDGPGQYTERLLDCLERNQAKATFFMLGESVPDYPNAVKRMDQLGCEIGNHSYNHANLANLKPEDIGVQVGQTNQNLINIIGRGASVLRPPYGSIDDEVKAHAGMPMVFWDIDTLDWQTLDVQSNIDSVLNQVKDGDIILMHDIHRTSVEAAEFIIPALIERGYQLTTVTDLAASKGQKLEIGATYYSFP